MIIVWSQELNSNFRVVVSRNGQGSNNASYHTHHTITVSCRSGVVKHSKNAVDLKMLNDRVAHNSIIT